MTVRGRIRGVSERSGIYLTGRPQQLVACDDGLVLIPASALSTPLSGPLAGSVLERRIATQVDGQDVTAGDLGASQKRARTVLWDAVESALLEVGYPGRRLTLVTHDRRLQHKYGKLESDAFLAPLLCAALGGGFRDTRPEQ